MVAVAPICSFAAAASGSSSSTAPAPATARGEGYYKKYLANRADRSGRLLPPSPEAEQLVPLRPLEQHVLQ
ncbi:hypothetical protein HaLaN_25570 [Haematococcus lacustris]|uniref:Uncharacterized protein n=1 Tax=Haematococcus lacustris TaxID=44745 RepID=A0A6A0A436_HAELA|nr:hypothetical protein HaLaN_25570 [Haematococcus lacustris]